jgi:DNA-binding MarR family transcriptional regulator
MSHSHTNSQTERQTIEGPIGEADLHQAAISVRIAIARTARRLRQEGASDLSPTVLAALASIDRHGPVTPTRLAELEGVKRPTITRVIGHLEEGGLIERRTDPDDGRSCLLTVSPVGVDYLSRLRTRKSAFLADLLASLPAEDAEILVRASEILDAALREPVR